MAVFGVTSGTGSIDEMSQHQRGRYISGNGAGWRISRFDIQQSFNW